MTKASWCSPTVYDVTRTPERASVPNRLTLTVPEAPGAYAIYHLGQAGVFETILDFGECGLRPNSKPHGLRGRLASNAAHSASARIALDLARGRLQGDLRVVWLEAETKELAKEIQDGLLSLFRRECGRQPRYNSKVEHHPCPGLFESVYSDLKVVARCTT